MMKKNAKKKLEDRKKLLDIKKKRQSNFIHSLKNVSSIVFLCENRLPYFVFVK